VVKKSLAALFVFGSLATMAGIYGLTSDRNSALQPVLKIHRRRY